MLVVVRRFDTFNHRRYGNPWVAIVSKDTGKIDFSNRVGGYTGGYGKGDAGDLYINNPVVGAVYAYGQKDYRGSSGGYYYVKYIGDGHFEDVEKNDLIKALS